MRPRYNGRMLSLAMPLPKRLTRSANPKPFVLTDRDIQILFLVARYRFLSSQQIVRALRIADASHSEQQILRRLQGLFENHFLDRPPHQQFHLALLAPIIYGLGREGARLLADHGHDINAHLSWTAKNNRASSLFLNHTLETANTMIAIEEACATHGLTLIDHHHLRPYLPAQSTTRDNPFRFRVTASLAGETVNLSVLPDRVFSIAGLANNQRLNFALELDRGTEQLTAKRLTRKSTFARKIVGFSEVWRAGLHQSQLGFEGMRILFVTTSQARIKGMRTVQRKLIGDRLASMFLYTTADNINTHTPLAPIWLAANTTTPISWLPQED